MSGNRGAGVEVPGAGEVVKQQLLEKAYHAGPSVKSHKTSSFPAIKEDNNHPETNGILQ